MITVLKILTTPYYVDHHRSFVGKPMSRTADGKMIQSRPLMNNMFIAFVAERDRVKDDRVVVIMDSGQVWLFENAGVPAQHFTIGSKIPPPDMEQYILDLYTKGDKIKIEYENV